MIKKEIVKANLGLRFYVDDGWSRKEVCDLLIQQEIEAVLPRYMFAHEADTIRQGFMMPSSVNDTIYDDCYYFIVLSPDHLFDEEKINQYGKVRYPPMS